MPRRLRPPTFLRVVCRVRLHVRPHAAHDDREDDAWHVDETPCLHAPCFIVCVEDEANKGGALFAALQSGGRGGAPVDTRLTSLPFARMLPSHKNVLFPV